MRRIVLLVISLLLSSGSLFARPLSPESIASLRASGQLDEVLARERAARARGFDRPAHNILPAMRDLRRDDADEITINIPVILLDFADNQANVNQHPVGYYENQFFSDGVVRTGSAHEWYQENSYGEINFQGQVVGWVRAPQTYAYYVGGNNGRGNYPRNSLGMAEAAIRGANGQIDYSDFDNDGDGVVETVAIIHAGPGAESNNGDPDMIWAHMNWLSPINLRLDNVRFDTYFTVSEVADIGGITHECGHGYFGLPDLYDTDQSSHGLGLWSVMAGGGWLGGGSTPAHFDAWCKVTLGLVEPVITASNTFQVMIPPVEARPVVYKVWTRGNQGTEYFLIENRQDIGFEANLPGTGLCIFHIDENAGGDWEWAPNNDEWYPGHQNQGHYKVALEQADNEWDLERNDSPGDRGDPFPGMSENSRFDAASTPNSRNYRGEQTSVVIDEIRQQSDMIFCNIVVGRDVDQPDITVDQWKMEYGLVTMNDPADRILTILNIGNEPLSITDIRLTGDDAEQFSVPDWEGDIRLDTGAELDLRVRFAATTIGKNNAEMVIISNDPDESPFSILLTGIGDPTPVITRPSREITFPVASVEGQPLHIEFAAHDPLGDGLIWEMNNSGRMSDDARFTDNGDGTASLDWTPDTASSGRYAPAFQVSSHDTLRDQIRLAITVSEFVGVTEEEVEFPREMKLYGASPNPFNGQTVIAFDLDRSGVVDVGVFDLAGQRIATVRSEHFEAGNHKLVWNAEGIPTGVYFVRVTGPTGVRAMRAALVR